MKILSGFSDCVRKFPFFSGFLFLILLGKMLLAGISIHSVPAEFYRRYEFIAFELLSVIIYAVILLAILLSVSKRPFLRWIVMTVILLGMFYWLVSPRTRPFADKHRCQENLRKIADACQAYADDHGDCYPPSLEKLAELKYMDIETLHCPGNRWHNPGGNDYLYHGAGVQLGKERASAVLVQDKPENHIPGRYGTKLLFEDSFVPME